MGGKLNTTNGSQFKLKRGDLPPPATWTDGKKTRKYGDPVTITMKVDKVDDQLVFTFQPSGCHFNPSAELMLSWKGLKAKDEVATINLLDDMDEPIEADKVDTRGQNFLMWISHFSRYAISKGH